MEEAAKGESAEVLQEMPFLHSRTDAKDVSGCHRSVECYSFFQDLP